MDTPKQEEEPRLGALLTPAQLAERAAAAQAEYEVRLARASLGGLTLRTAAEDMHEVLVALPADAAAARSIDLVGLLSVNDRLRGLGLVFIVAGLLLGILALALV